MNEFYKEDIISVIVAIYNVEKYLPECVDSIFRQTYNNLDIILVDDGSTDHSGIMCDEFAKIDKRVIVIHQKNTGLWAARNTGRSIARGNYVMFVDGDDYLNINAVKVLFDSIKQSEDYDMAFADNKITNRRDENVEMGADKDTVNEKTVYTQEELIKGMFSYDIFGFMWNKVYRRSLISNVWCNHFIRNQDFDFNFRVYLKIRKAVIIHRELYYYYQRQDSLMNNPQTRILSLENFINIFYSNYMGLSAFHKRKYGYLLLRKLYKKMVFWKNRNFMTCNESTVFKKCREYEISTRKAYWLSWRINPIEKIGVTILLHNPRLTRWLMRVTKNY